MGHRLIRLVGDPSPWADQAVAKALVGKRLPLAVAEALAFYGKWQMQALVVGTTHRSIGLESGYSRNYEFGPKQYAVWMDEADAARLLRNEWERWQFLDITDTPWVMERPRMTNRDWARLLDSFAKLDKGRQLRPAYRTRGSDLPPRAFINSQPVRSR